MYYIITKYLSKIAQKSFFKEYLYENLKIQYRPFVVNLKSFSIFKKLLQIQIKNYNFRMILVSCNFILL